MWSRTRKRVIKSSTLFHYARTLTGWSKCSDITWHLYNVITLDVHETLGLRTSWSVQQPFVPLASSLYSLLVKLVAIVLESRVFAMDLSFSLQCQHELHVLIADILLDLPLLETIPQLLLTTRC